MVRKTEVENTDQEKTRKFIDKNWQKALIVAGAAGVIGAAVWLTARYLREKKIHGSDIDEALIVVEDEVEAGFDQTSVMLETGTYLGSIAGEESKTALAELVSQMDDVQAREALEILKQVIDMDLRK